MPEVDGDLRRSGRGVQAGLSYNAIEELVVAHPTYAEGLASLLSIIKPLRPDM
jgi:hypothetical protein